MNDPQNSAPTVSVAMVTYNHERYIAQAIESVLNQETTFPVELVIGEDCSPDGTRRIVEEFQRKYPGRVRPILRPSNIGASKNMASVYAACRGRYIAILEGDDYWTSTRKLQTQADFLDRHPECAICCHRVQYFYEDGSRPPHEFRPDLAAGIYSLDDIILDFFVKPCSVLIRQECLRTLPDWCFATFIGDWPQFCMAARHGQIAMLDDNMAAYRVHQGGVWSGGVWDGRWAAKTMLAEQLRRTLPRRYKPKLDNVVFRGYYMRALDRLKKNNLSEARGFAARCLASTPVSYQTRAKAALLLEAFAPPLHRMARRLAHGPKPLADPQ